MTHTGPRPGAVAIITDEKKENFALQRKDATHPIEACRLKLSLFGGSMDPEESPRNGLERELAEEINDDQAVNTLHGQIAAWRSFELDGNQYRGHYKLHAFVCQLSDRAFRDVAAKLQAPGTVLEGSSEVLTREALLVLLENTDNFVGSLDQVLKAFLSGTQKI